MSKKLKYNSTVIELPKDYIIKNEKGDKIADTLTKKGNLTSKNKLKSVQLVANEETTKPKILNPGETVEYIPKIKKVIKKNKSTGDIIKKVKKEKEEKIKVIEDIKKSEIKKMSIVKPKTAEIKTINNNDDYNNEKLKVFNEINDFNLILSTSRKDQLRKINDYDKKLNILANVQDLGNFFQTPDYIADFLYEDVKVEYYKNILDIGCGLLGLTKTIIKNMLDDKMKYINNIYLNEVNNDFVKILKPLTNDKRIDLYDKDILKNYNYYFDKNLNLIVSNPPFTAWVDNKELNNGYLFFLYAIYRIAMKNSNYSKKPVIYIIMPLTYYDKELNNLKIPSKTRKDIIKYFKKVDKEKNISYGFYDEDLEESANWFYNVKIVKEISSFKKYDVKQSKISDMKIKTALFEFML